MKLRQFLKNLAKNGLKLFILACLIGGCSSSTTPTYLKEDIDKAIQDICRKEYKIDIKAKLVGQTVWIYLPLQDIVTKSDKPEKYIERFSIEHNSENFKDGELKLEYAIRAVPEQEKYQEVKFDKSIIEKMNNVWKALRRVLFSMEQIKKGGPQFFCLVLADIKNGFEISEIFYYLDIKKVSYEFISWTEYQHRAIQDTVVSPRIIGDKEGSHLDYRDIPFEEFISKQIQHRIKLKFQKPEVDKNVDIDKEILKIVVYTLKMYDFKNFSVVELNNMLTNNKIFLNEAAVWAKPIEQRF